MNNTTICKFIICIGILRQSSLHHVDGIPFQVSEMMEWSKAECTCQKYNGTLFIPNETLFDVSPFGEFNFNDESWVAATCIILSDFASASWLSDSVVRCEMCKIEKNCGTTCLYTACGNRCKTKCESLFDSHIRVLYDIPNNWTGARELCQQHGSKIGDRIQNASSLFPKGYCNDGCFWTKHLIKVQFQTKTAPENEQGECGILHKGILSFTSCNRKLHPLCKREANTALETPRPYFSDGSNSSILMNTKIGSMTTTHASKSTNRINATIKMSSTYGASSVANDIAKRTTNRLSEENSSLLVPVGATTSRNYLEDSPHKSDTGIIIGAVTGSFVFLMMTVLGIIFFRRRLLQRTGEKKSKHDRKTMKMTRTDKTDPASMLDSEGSKFSYETLTKNVNVNSSDPNFNINYDGYDHLNRITEGRDDNETGNVYETVNAE